MSDRGASRDARSIAAILRGGLVLSLAAMIVGVVVAARELPVDAVRMTPFEMSVTRHAGSTIAMVGILILGATPALRVVALVVLWTLERDRRFSLTAAAVVAILVLAALLGRG